MKRSTQAALLAGGMLAGVLAWTLYPGASPAPTSAVDPPAGKGPVTSPTPLAKGNSSSAEAVSTPVAKPSFDAGVVHSKLRAWREARARDSEDELDQCMKALLSLVTDENAAQILQSLSKEEWDTPFTEAVFRRWMQVDPVQAANWTGFRSDGADSPLIAVAAEEWVKDQPGLLSYVDHLPDTAWKQNLLSASGLELSLKDPQGAIALAQRMKPGDEQTHLLQAVLCDWVSREPATALNWILDVHEPALRESLTAAAAKSYALNEPRLAAAWVISNVGSEKIKNDAVLSIIETWSSTDPENAAKWASTELDGATQKAAVNIISSHWMNSNPTAAQAWVQNLPKNPGR